MSVKPIIVAATLALVLIAGLNSSLASSRDESYARPPVALASEVLRNTSGNWTPAAIEAAMNGATTQRVNLLKPIRVMILYGTAMATEAGKDLFFDDVYGYDRKLESLLGLGPSS